MANKKSSSKKIKKRYTFQPTFGSLFLISLGLLFVLGWVFTLGIMVGRNYLPGILSAFSLTKEKLAKDGELKAGEKRLPIREEDLTFYNQLVNKKNSIQKERLAQPSAKKQESTIKNKKIERVKETIRGYSVQVAALKDNGETEKMVEKLKRLGYQAYFYQTLINSTVFYRIRCGPFATVEEAKRCAKRLTDKERLKPFIVYPPKD